MPSITLSHLHSDPRNANACSPEVLAKIRRNIEQAGLYPALIVRPHPTIDGHYILIDGHHRKAILEELGYSQADCQVWNIDAGQAGLALATLNRLRGEDIPRKRAELIESLAVTFALPDLAALIPESEREIKDLLALLQLDEEKAEARIKAEIEREKAELPVPFTCMVPAADYSVIEEALARFDGADQGTRLVAMCRQILDEGVDDDG